MKSQKSLLKPYEPNGLGRLWITRLEAILIVFALIMLSFTACTLIQEEPILSITTGKISASELQVDTSGTLQVQYQPGSSENMCSDLDPVLVRYSSGGQNATGSKVRDGLITVIGGILWQLIKSML